MKKILKISAIASAILTPTFAQAQATSPMEVSATVQAGCFIEADNISFGVLRVPLTAEQTNSKVYVKCSNQQPYSIDFFYGNSSQTTETGTLVEIGTYLDPSMGFANKCTLPDGRQGHNWNNHTKTGFVCTDTSSPYGLVSCTINPTSNLGYDSLKVCTAYVSNGFISTNLTIGIMNGATKGDRVAYVAQIPNTTTNWYIGNGKNYSSVGNGLFQEISYNIKIIPSQSSSGHLAPDSYSDTSRLQINF